MAYFDEQNALIDAGTLKAEKITVSALMINKWVYLVQYTGHLQS